MSSSPPSKGALRGLSCPLLHAVLASALLLLCLVPANAFAQQPNRREISKASLPDAPPLKSGLQGSANSLPVEGSGSVAGIVLDVSGAVVEGANVSLVHRD